MIPNKDTLEIPKLHINLLFEGGVEHAEWLRPWRLFNTSEKNDLEAIITSLRRQEPPTAGASRAYLGVPGATAAAATEIRDDDEQCMQCRHNHTNARCYKQHPGRHQPAICRKAPEAWRLVIGHRHRHRHHQERQGNWLRENRQCLHPRSRHPRRPPPEPAAKPPKAPTC